MMNNDRLLIILSRLEYELRKINPESKNLEIARTIIEELGGITSFYDGNE